MTKKWIFIALFLILLIWIIVKKPSHEGEWHPLQAQLPSVELVADRYKVSNIRDFLYDHEGSVTSANYLTQEYSLDQLIGVWLGLSHFAGYGFAHAFLSFEFANPDAKSDSVFLVVSVEARIRPEQRYSPLKGLFRNYQRINVLGTEEDIIGLRSYVRGEKVYLYPLTLPIEHQHYLFNSLMEETQTLNQQPAFYNTLLHNCVTSLLKHDPDYRFSRHMFDYRVLLPGFGDEFAQEKGWLEQGVDISLLRAKGRISASVNPQEQTFSELIRQH
ncbi:DUF4105 domain-containing protein [Nitrincola schmidtii]|uniref:lipoprotein N-acyltransferase Lnb domain-containing protein n=1 Tax=Nitrincola schmidtii TaxID=1730894 RepID=UPI0014572627|nr:DUF4105 domain-containing protein [Nitrincola schmidtii]